LFPLIFGTISEFMLQQGLFKSVKSWIPNGITLLNLMMGCVGVSLAAWGDLVGACQAVMLAAVFDLFDGMAARALGVVSPLGKDLDSLADVVSFGLVPAFILYQLSASSPGLPGSEWIVYLYTLAAALRLARFNQDARQTKSFRGLASPAAALLLVSAVAFLGQNDAIAVHLRAGLTKINIYTATLGTALLMLIPLPMPSLKIGSGETSGEGETSGKGASKRDGTPASRRDDLIILGASALSGGLALLFLSVYAGISCVILTYILLSFLRLFISPKST